MQMSHALIVSNVYLKAQNKLFSCPLASGGCIHHSASPSHSHLGLLQVISDRTLQRCLLQCIPMPFYVPRYLRGKQYRLLPTRGGEVQNSTLACWGQKKLD